MGCLLTGKAADVVLIIDQFTVTQSVAVPPSFLSTGRVSDSASNTFLGSDREVLVQRSAGSANSVSIGSGALNFVTAITGRAEILYDGLSGDNILAAFNAVPELVRPRVESHHV